MPDHNRAPRTTRSTLSIFSTALAAAMPFTSPQLQMFYQRQEFVDQPPFDPHTQIVWDQFKRHASITDLDRDLISVKRNPARATSGLHDAESLQIQPR